MRRPLRPAAGVEPPSRACPREWCRSSLGLLIRAGHGSSAVQPGLYQSRPRKPSELFSRSAETLFKGTPIRRLETLRPQSSAGIRHRAIDPRAFSGGTCSTGGGGATPLGAGTYLAV